MLGDVAIISIIKLWRKRIPGLAHWVRTGEFPIALRPLDFLSAPVLGTTSGTHELSSMVSLEEIVSVAPFGSAGRFLYRRNAFRVTGLNVSIPESEIRSLAQELRIRTRLSPEIEIDCGPLSDARKLRPLVLEQYVSRLLSPESRLVDELFWFWPLDWSGRFPDPGLLAVSTGSLVDARSAWQEASLSSVSSLSVRHNLAVLDHLFSLESSEIERDNTLRQWHSLCESEEIRRFLRERFGVISGGARSDDFVGQLLDALPSLLAKSYADRDKSIIEQGGSVDLKVTVSAFTSAGFPEKCVRDAYTEAAEPLKARIRLLAKQAEANLPEHGDVLLQAVESLILETVPLLKKLAQLLGPESTTYAEVSDRVALAGLSVIIRAADSSPAWDRLVYLLEHLGRIARGASVQSRINDNISIAVERSRQARLFDRLQPIEQVPSLSTFNGIGTRLYGRREYDPDTDSYVATHYFTFAYYPLVPIARYRIKEVGSDRVRFLGRLPVVPLDFSWLALPIIALIVMSIAGSCSQNQYSSAGYSPQKTQTTKYSAPRPPAQRAVLPTAKDRQLEALDKAIEDGRTSLSQFESRLELQEAQATAMGDRIDFLSTRASQLEAAFSVGDLSDTLLYEEVIQHHNLLIDSVAEKVQRYKTTFAQYKKLYDSVAALIVRYNALN